MRVSRTPSFPLTKPRYRPRLLRVSSRGSDELATLFAREHAELVAHWRKQRRSHDSSRRLQQLHASEQLPALVSEVTRELARSGRGISRFAHTVSPGHGILCFQEGLSVREVVVEYRFLREAFASVAARHGLPLVGDAARIVHDRLDESIALAVEAFTDQRALAQARKQREQLAFLAHDMRVPVAAIALAAEELTSILSNGARGTVAIVGRNADRLESMLEEALHRYAHEAFVPERRRIQLGPLVRRLIQDLQPLVAKAAVEVRCDVPPDLTVIADGALLTQVFQNLLSNACAHAHSGRVEVRAWQSDAEVSCEVVDDGEGIPERMLHSVFAPLQSGSGKLGKGLGLTIVKQIIEAHGGTVVAEHAPGGGACFRFTLPSIPRHVALDARD